MSKQIDEIPLVTFRLDNSSGLPMYKQLYDILRNAILEGKLEQGQKLPGSRSLASGLKISRNTVSLAYDQLIIEGYIKGKSGSGSYVSEIPDNYLTAKRQGSSPDRVKRIIRQDKKFGSSELMNRNRKLEEIIPFQHGSPAMDEFPIMTWTKLINQTAREFQSLHKGYADAAGYLPLREAIAKYLTTYRAVSCSADQVLIVSGSQQGIDLVGRVMLKHGSRVWIEDPGYYGARGSLIFADSRIYPCPVDENGLKLTYSAKKYPVPDLIYTTPSHQYPLGYTMSIGRRLELLEFAKRNNVWIIEDDYDSEFRYFGNPLPALQGMDLDANVIYLGTFSKVLFPGLRIGYLVLPDSKVHDIFAAAKSIIDRQSPIFEQVILTKFIEEGYFTRHIRKMRMLYKSRQEFLISEIDKELNGLMTVNPSPSGMHLIGYLTGKMNAKTISAEALNSGVIVPPLSDYSILGSGNNGLFLGYSAFNEKEISKGIKKLKNVLINPK